MQGKFFLHGGQKGLCRTFGNCGTIVGSADVHPYVVGGELPAYAGDPFLYLLCGDKTGVVVVDEEMLFRRNIKAPWQRCGKCIRQIAVGAHTADFFIAELPARKLVKQLCGIPFGPDVHD